VPTIYADNANVRYYPIPFPVTVTVTNEGDMRTDSVFAEIVLPPDLKLAENDAPDCFTKTLKHPRLFPQQSSTTQWMVTHPPTTEEKQYTIQVWVKTANADSSLCEAVVTIPPLESPILAPRCYVPNELVFDDTLDSYVPNPFTVRLTCVNNGNTPAYNVTGTIELPPNVEFDPPGQRRTKRVYPSPLEKYQIGNPIPELTWTVRWIPRLRTAAQPEFRFTVTGENSEGSRLDSTEVRCQVSIPGLLPLFEGHIDIPDSLPSRSDTCDVWPNPFPVRLTLRNISPQVGMIRRIVLYFPTSDGLSLNPASQFPTDFDPVLTLDKGEEKTFEWFIDVKNRITRRVVLITAIAYDDEGNPMAHDDWLPIATMKTALWDGCLESSASILRYDAVSESYNPDRFVITSTLHNGGCATLHEIVARLVWLDSSGLDLIEFDPDFEDNTNPKTRDTMSYANTVPFSWGFRVKNRNTTGIPQYVPFHIEYGSRETPYITNGCETYVEIDPAGTTGVTDSPAPEKCVLHPAHPNPFTLSTSIRFSLTRAMPVTLTVADALGRERRRLVDDETRSAGSHTLRFDAEELRPGIYFIRLLAGELLRLQKMVLVR
jgi:hypothetical protein